MHVVTEFVNRFIMSGAHLLTLIWVPLSLLYIGLFIVFRLIRFIGLPYIVNVRFNGDSIRIRDLKTGEEKEFPAAIARKPLKKMEGRGWKLPARYQDMEHVNGFAHERSVVNNIEIAARTLAVRLTAFGGYFWIKPVLILTPTHFRNEDLADFEKDQLIKLGNQGGGCLTSLYFGPELANTEDIMRSDSLDWFPKKPG